MQVDVYADLLFLINAGMDGLCLLLAARLLHRRLSVGRWVLGTLIGGLYAVLALFWSGGTLPALLIDLGVCLLMCGVVFAERGGLRRLPGVTVVYIALSMVMGGVMTGLASLFNRTGLTEHLPAGDEGIGAWLFVLLAVAGSIVTLRGGRRVRRAASATVCRVTLEVDGRTVELSGLLDTGNLLRDPVGGQAVILADADTLSAVLSPALAAIIRDGVDAPEAALASLSGTPDARRLRLIPAGTATGGGLLPGIRPDRVTLIHTGRRGEVTRTVDATVAAGSLPGVGEGITALVPGELM